MDTNEISRIKAQFAKRDSGNDAPRHSINAALQRSGTYVYRDNLRQAMRQDMQEYLVDIAQEYTSHVDDEKQIKNINAFANMISEKHGAILKNGRFRIGVAQKALNLYLKYQWCKGEIAIPPHCPFDRGILFELSLNGVWTKMDSMDDYKTWVAAARNKAKAEGYGSIAEWELMVWGE